MLGLRMCVLLLLLFLIDYVWTLVQSLTELINLKPLCDTTQITSLLKHSRMSCQNNLESHCQYTVVVIFVGFLYFCSVNRDAFGQ